MAQTPHKPRKPPSTSSTSKLSKKTSSNPKKGARTIAPKKKTLVKQNRITKKYTAGLTGKTERTLAEKVGHLEMLAGGKKRGGGEEKKVGGKKAGEKSEGKGEGKGKGKGQSGK